MAVGVEFKIPTFNVESLIFRNPQNFIRGCKVPKHIAPDSRKLFNGCSLFTFCFKWTFNTNGESSTIVISSKYCSVLYLNFHVLPFYFGNSSKTCFYFWLGIFFPVNMRIQYLCYLFVRVLLLTIGKQISNDNFISKTTINICANDDKYHVRTVAWRSTLSLSNSPRMKHISILFLRFFQIKCTY